MIGITYEPERCRLTLRGHAGAGESGQDLICCAVSALTYTLAANVRRMQKRGWLARAHIRLSPGDADISCVPGKGCREAVMGRMDAICMGFWMLSREYPDFVRFQLHSKEVCEHEERSA